MSPLDVDSLRQLRERRSGGAKQPTFQNASLAPTPSVPAVNGSMAERLEALRAKRGTATPVAPAPVTPVPEAPKELPQPVQDRPDILSTFGGGFAPEKLPKDAGPLGAADVALALGGAPIQFLTSSAAGLGALGAGSVGELLGLHEATPEQITGGAEAAQAAVAEKFYAPLTQSGQEISEFLGKGIEKFLTPAHKIKEKLTEAGYPRTGFVAGLLTELAEFEIAGLAFRKVKAGEKVPAKEKLELAETVAKEKGPQVAEELLTELEAAENEVFKVGKPPEVEGLADVPLGPAPKTSKVSGNQAIVDRLLEIAETKEGFSKKSTKKAADIIADLTQDAAEVDFKGVKGVGKKTQAVIDEVLAKRPKVEEKAPVIPEEIVPPELPKEVVKERRKDAKALKGPERRTGKERRQDLAKRKRIEDMTPDEMRQELLVNPVTGILNKRALQEAERGGKKAKAFLDVDSLKYVNDNLGGHAAGDKLLTVVADAVERVAGEEGYHISGDEFIIRAATKAAAKILADRVNEILSTKKLEFESGGKKFIYEGPGVSAGIGKTQKAADALLIKDKKAREKAGLRGGRGKQPPGVREVVEPTVEPAVVEPTVPAGLRTFETPEAAKAKFELGTEVPEAQAIREFQDVGGLPDITVAKVGDKYFRATKRAEEALPAELPIEERAPVVEELREPTQAELVAEVPVEKTVRIQGQEVPTSKAAQAFSEYRNSLVRKSDKAIEPKDAAIADKSYATFKTEAEARAHAEAEGLKGEVFQDPLTGEWVVEPDFPALEDLGYENREAADYALEREERALTEEVDSSLDMGEPTDGMFRDLVDIFDNERGSVAIYPLKKLVDFVQSVREKFAHKKFMKSFEADAKTFQGRKEILEEVGKFLEEGSVNIPDVDNIRQSTGIDALVVKSDNGKYILGSDGVYKTLRNLSHPDIHNFGYRFKGASNEFIKLLTKEYQDGLIDLGELNDGLNLIADFGPSKGLFGILKSERGAITVDQKDLVAMRRHVERVKQLLKNAQNVKLGSEPARETINRYLDQLGVSDESKAKFQTQAERLAEDVKSLREADPITENILNPEGKVIHQRDVKTKKGSAKGPPVTEEQIRTVRNARKLFWGKGKLGRAGELFEIRQEAFERFGKPIKEMFFDRWQEKLTDSQRELKTTQKEIIRPLKKQLTKQEIRDLSVAWASEQKGGVEALAADGIKVIPKLNEKQLQAKEILNREFESLLDRINYVRVRTGRDPIPKLDNYFPFIHQQNALKKAGIHENILTIPVDKIASSSKKFRGTFFPFEKPRKVTDIPIELDVINAYDTYLKTALKEIHVSPIAALAKEFANERILDPDNPKAKSQSLNDYNPDMARVLNKWADEIMGNDPVGSILGIEMPAFKKFMDKRAANLVASVIFGNVGTVLKQPTALRGVYAETTHLDLVNGIARTAFEKPFRLGKTRAQKLSNVLQIRSADILFSEMAEAIATGNISGAKRVIGQIAAAPMNIVDAITAEAAWNAGYSYGKRKLKLSDKEAVRHADDVVGRTQGIGIKGAVSPIQANAIGKWFTLLNTFAIADFNFLAKQILGIKNPDITKPAQVKRALKYVIGGALINEAFRATGQEAPFPSPFTTYSDAMDEGDSSRLAMAKAFKESLEVLPLIGGAVKYESSVGGPIGQLALDVPKAVSQTFNMVDHERMSKKEFQNSLLFIGDTVGQYYGIPMTRQLKKSIRAIAQDGDWPQILLGLYVKDEKKGLKGIGGLGGLKGLD